MDNVENIENNDDYGKTTFGQNSLAIVGPSINAEAVTYDFSPEFWYMVARRYDM